MISHPQIKIENYPIEVYCEGACEPTNPGGIATYGFVIYKNKIKIAEQGAFVAKGEGATNNVAEYVGAIKALEYLQRQQMTRLPVMIYSDSMLLVNQLNGAYQVKSERIAKFYNLIKKLIEKFDKVGFTWIPRNYNHEADLLSKQAYKAYCAQNQQSIGGGLDDNQSASSSNPTVLTVDEALIIIDREIAWREKLIAKKDEKSNKLAEYWKKSLEDMKRVRAFILSADDKTP